MTAAMIADESFPVGPATITPGTDSAVVVLGPDKAIWASGLGVYLVDGEKGESIPLSPGTGGWIKSEDEFEATSLANGLELEHRLRKRDGLLLWAVEITNNGPERRLLEIALAADLRNHAAYLRNHAAYDYWNGQFVRRAVSGAFRQRDVFGLPLSAAFVDGKPGGGLALGVAPDQYLSYIEAGVDTLGAWRFDYLARLVVDPGDSERVEFTVIPFSGDHGYHDAADIYHRAYPRYFDPRPGVDPRVNKPNDVYYGTYLPTKGELIRRSGHGMSWWYAPFKRPGDFYASRESWDWPEAEEWYRKNSKAQVRAHWDRFGQLVDRRLFTPQGGHRGNLLDFDAFHRDRHDIILQSAQENNLAIMFYLADWANVGLIQQRGWEDLKVTDPRYSNLYGAYVSHWSPPESEHRIYWGGGFAEDTKNDLLALGDELNISGFAFDVATGGPRYYTDEKLDDMPGRGFDERGVFYDTGIGIAEIKRFTQEMDLHDYWQGDVRGGVVTNVGVPRYYTAIYSDSVLGETGDVGEALNELHHLHNHRLVFGRKPSFIHENQAKHNLYQELDWKHMEPAEIRDVYRRMYDGQILVYAAYGMVPGGSLTHGVEKLRRYLPMLLEISAAGWRPTPGLVDLNEVNHVLLSRFGVSLKDYLWVAANGNLHAAALSLVANPNYFDGKSPIPFPAGGARQSAVIRDDGKVLFDAEVPSGEATVWRIRAALEGAPDVRVVASETEGHFEISRFLELESPKSRTVTLHLALPEGYDLHRLIVNDSAMDYAIENGETRVEIVCGPDATSVQAVFRSRIIHAPDQALQDFPYIENLRAVSQIIIPDQATEAERLLAQRIHNYFEFYTAYRYEDFLQRARLGPTRVETAAQIPIRFTSEAVAGVPSIYIQAEQGRRWVFGLPTPEKGVSLAVKDTPEIFIYASNRKDGSRFVDDLLFMLDEKFHWVGLMPNIAAGEAGEHMRKAGLFGGVLTEAEAEQGEGRP